MELKEGTSVFSADGEEIGKINRFVINPVSKRMSHFIVQAGLVFPEDRVVPIGWVESADADRVTLTAKSNEVLDLPPFEEVHFVSLDETEQQRNTVVTTGTALYYYWYPPLGTPAFTYPHFPPNMAAQTERNIPENSVPLKEGADVISVEGNHIGDVERVFIDPESNRATHLLISQGILMKARKMVPVDWISTLEEEKVYLAVGEKVVERLPDYQS